VFREDLRKLKAIKSDCCWVAEAVAIVAKTPVRSTKTKHGTK
jgi:hypothetical protein